MRYSAYKPLDELWLTTIPLQWKARKIKYLFSERSEKGYPDEPLLVASQSMGVVPKDIYGNRTVEATKDLHLLKLVRIGDFVISLRSFQGGLEYAYYQGIISPAYTILVTNGLVTSGYFKYLAKSRRFIKLLQTCVTGIREGQNVDYTKLKNHYIPIPSYEDQNQIVRFLDWKTSEMAHFIKEKKQEIKQLTELKHSIISRAVLKGIDNGARMKPSTTEWIGKIPCHWDELMLFQCAVEHNLSNKNVHHQNLLSLSYGKIVRKDINTTTGLLPTSYDTYQIIHNNNIILRLTDLQNDRKSLRVGLSTETGIITSAYTCLKARQNIMPEYLYLLLHSYDVRKVFYSMGGGVRQSIGYGDIRRMVLLLPPMDEQKRIVEYCYAQQDRIELLIEGIKREISLVQELRIVTIADVVTGKVDVRNVVIPEYDPETEAIDDIGEEAEGDSEEILEKEVNENAD